MTTLQEENTRIKTLRATLKQRRRTRTLIRLAIAGTFAVFTGWFLYVL